MTALPNTVSEVEECDAREDKLENLSRVHKKIPAKRGNDFIVTLSKNDQLFQHIQGFVLY